MTTFKGLGGSAAEGRNLSAILPEFRKFPEEFFFLFAEVRRYLDGYMNDLVSPAGAPEVGHPLSLEAEDAAVLGSLGDFYCFHALERRHR